jgi:hypothetical protein
MSSLQQKISLLCPTRQRPAQALRLILTVLETAQVPQRVEVLFYIDADDPTREDYIKQFQSKEAELKQFDRCLFLVGDPIGISKAWNELAEKSQGDLLIMAADDQIYNTPGWDTRLDQEVQKYPDRIFCMWFNEGHWGAKLCTFPIVSRQWYSTLSYFTTGMFECLYDDLWITDLAKRVDRLHYIPDILTEHFHWSYGKSAIDSTYQRKQVGPQGKIKPAVKRDMDLFLRTGHYREADAKKLAAVMEGGVKLNDGLPLIQKPSILQKT